MWWPTFSSRRKSRETDFDRALQFHIDEAVSNLVSQGAPQDEARRRVMLEFGGKEQAAQAVRDVHSSRLLERTAANLKSGFRLMHRAPGFALAVVLTLALGIGANSAVFSAIDAVLLRPLPFPHAGELVLVGQQHRRSKEPSSFVAPIRLEDWNRLNSTFQALTGYYAENASDTSGELPEKVTLAFVAPRFLQVWGVAPALGRGFTPDEEKFGGPLAVLISDRYWHRRFHGDPAAVGKSVRLGQTEYRVAGVMPASFLFPIHEADLWSPIPTGSPYAQSRESTWYTVR